MRLLLDTQVLLWAIYQRLSPARQERLRDRDNDVFFSAVTIAEIALKASLRRTDFPFEPREVSEAARSSAFDELALTADQVKRLALLPWHHRDPFDRMLVAQAIEEGLRLITADRALSAYTDLVEVI
ncbi:MAG: type II toxin-antitoxin system VapC family toxin [Rhodocyclaceae bacterium]|nr:type II toxin-antitoxin system VapC family toxin [Rhodocyclaceae bacterium]